MTLKPTPWEDKKISLPATHPRARHPHDPLTTPRSEEVLSTSSAGQHMAVGRVSWKDETHGKYHGRSTQTGSHFDTRYHFQEDGAKEIDTGRIQGSATVIDLREYLVKKSDGLAITVDLIRTWVERSLDHFHKRSFGKAHWERILLRTLNDDQANSEQALEEFPYWDSAEAVSIFIESIKEKTGVDVLVILHESPSVDRVDQGCLAESSDDGKGGAHGAFAEKGVIIGENFDFRKCRDGAQGAVAVMLDANQLEAIEDAVPVSHAFFFPNGRVKRPS